MASKRSSVVLAAILAIAFAPLPAYAHLMVAQKGTLNLSAGGGFLVVSVPVTSFTGVDDNGDQLLSQEELSRHSENIREQISRGLLLEHNEDPCLLEGLMLSLSPPDGKEGKPADQLIVMGRYALPSGQKQLSFRVRLWGDAATNPSLAMTITKELKEHQLLILTPDHPVVKLYEPSSSVLLAYLKIGIEHVLTGFDHLLFLLVAIAAGLTWRKLLAVLSVFTVGHALSLTAVVVGGFTASAKMVEPAIAATIVALALHDLRSNTFGAAKTRSGRLGLVFACSLIHGLGLGDALTVLGLQPAYQGVTLLGFNLGVEVAQVAIAVMSLLVVASLSRLLGQARIHRGTRLVQMFAIAVGAAWFVQRLFFS